jgi:hypothetical protein
MMKVRIGKRVVHGLIRNIRLAYIGSVGSIIIGAMPSSIADSVVIIHPDLEAMGKAE